MAKFKAAHTNTKKVKKFTADKVEKITTLAFDMGKKAGKQVYTPKQEAKIKRNKYFIPAKNVGKGVLSFGLDIYSGMEEVQSI